MCVWDRVNISLANKMSKLLDDADEFFIEKNYNGLFICFTRTE